MKKIIAAIVACLPFTSVAVAFDDDYDDEDYARVYVTPRYYRTVEPVVVRREVIHQPVVYTEEPLFYREAPVRYVTPQEVRTRTFLRRTHQTAPNHR